MRLTEREREVMQLVVTGRANKQIAAELKPESGHREGPPWGQVMHKMQARSVVELVRMADRLGLAGSD